MLCCRFAIDPQKNEFMRAPAGCNSTVTPRLYIAVVPMHTTGMDFCNYDSPMTVKGIETV